MMTSNLKKKIFVWLAVLHGLLIAFLGLSKSLISEKFNIEITNVAFLTFYAVFIIYCTLEDAFLHVRKKRGLKIFRKRIPFFVLHISVFLLVVIFLSHELFFYKGSIILNEGEVLEVGSTRFSLQSVGFLTEKREFTDYLSKNKIELLKIEFDKNDMPVRAVLKVSSDDGFEQVSLTPNKPARIKDYYFFITDFSGYSPNIKIAFGDVVLLSASLALRKSNRKGIFEDSFFIQPFGRVIFRYDSTKDMLFMLNDSQKVIGKAPINGSFTVGEYLITFEGVSRWGRIDITMDKAAKYMIYAFLLLIFSLLWYYAEKKR